jgi:CHASE2 domain-containing sensor protein
MAKTGQPRRATLLRWLVLLPIPVVWAVLAQSGYLRGLENNLLDLRFRLRGEIPAPVKLVYVDVDTEAVEIIGERPWSRAIYADVAEVLLKLGGAKVVGFDFVMSKYGRKDAIVLIGPVDPLLQDLAVTPFDELVPGAEGRPPWQHGEDHRLRAVSAPAPGLGQSADPAGASPCW